MKQIRQSAFETNSSSVHSLTMCSGQQMQDWKDGKLFYHKYGREDWFPVTPELLAMDLEERMEGEELYTYDEFWESLDNGWAEGFERSYTTPNGETVYAFGYYGENR